MTDPDQADLLVVFDPPAAADLNPLTLTRPACGLRCGVGTLLDNQIAAHRPGRVVLWVRPALAHVARRIADDLRDRHGLACGVNEPLGDESATLVDGRTWWAGAAPPVAEESVEADDEGEPLRLRLRRPGLTADAFLDRMVDTLGGRARADCAGRAMRFWWDLVAHNDAALRHDAADFAANRADASFAPPPGVHLVKPESVHVAAGATLSPGVVLDASNGPIMLDAGAVVGANAVLLGPCYVGPGSTISPLSTLRPGANVGPACKVGGEVGNVVFQGRANKAHDGYLGDSYVGEWANLGAGTTTSNLKNTYGPVRAATPSGRVDTGLTFLGSVVGDHAKLGIGTMLSAGSHVGVAAQVAVPRPPQFVGDFRFLTPGGEEAYGFDKFVETAARVTARRGVTLAPEDVDLLRGIASR